MVNNPRDERCEQDGWAVIGIAMKGLGRQRKEVELPIGVYGDYDTARNNGDSWMGANQCYGIRYEITRLHKDVKEDEGFPIYPDAIDILTEGAGE